MADVFISYKAEEYDEANYMKMVLEKNRISCWMAPACIPGGSNYAREIPQAIRDARIFLLILSEKAQESMWVPKELDQAINAGKIVMPFMIENFTLSDDFNFYLSNVQRYTAYENKTAAIKKIIREIKGILGYCGNDSDEDVAVNMNTAEASEIPLEKNEENTVGILNEGKKKSFFSKLNAYNLENAKEPKSRFILNVFSCCSLIWFSMFMGLRLLAGEPLFIYDSYAITEIVLTGFTSAFAWYFCCRCCLFLSKIKLKNRLFKLLGLVLGISIYTIVFVVINFLTLFVILGLMNA